MGKGVGEGLAGRCFPNFSGIFRFCLYSEIPWWIREKVVEVDAVPPADLYRSEGNADGAPRARCWECVSGEHGVGVLLECDCIRTNGVERRLEQKSESLYI